MSKHQTTASSVQMGLSIESLEPLVLLSASCGGDMFYSVDTLAGCDASAGIEEVASQVADSSCTATVVQPDVLSLNLCGAPSNPASTSASQGTCLAIANSGEPPVTPSMVPTSMPVDAQGYDAGFQGDLLSGSDVADHYVNASEDLLEPPVSEAESYGSEYEFRPDSESIGFPEVPQNADLDDAVLQWNAFFGELLVLNESQQNPGYASRAMAMLNVAMYDAVTLAQGDSGDTFYLHDDVELESGIDAQAAAGQAAYTVLSSLYSGEQAFIDAFHHEFFACMDLDASSISLGDDVAENVLEARANDGAAYEVEYVFGDQPGDFRPDPLNPDVPVWGPGWGNVTPFSIASTDDFSPPTTPALDSVEYAASFNEVKELGSVDSEIRTAEQTEIGIFWAYDRVGMGTPMALFGNVLESVAINQGNTLEENAALFAQASVSMADAGIVAWDTKFSEEFWRPVTAIREAGLDGNSLTYGDPGWTALGAPDGGDDVVGFTPQFPTYISGHATFGGALFGAIRDFYGTDDISFDVTSKELEILMDRPELQKKYGLHLEDATRSYDSLSQAMAENGRSRVYLGIHFDFDDLVGREVGENVASAITPQFVVPTSGYTGRSSYA